jgi:two-component system, chemotaxis family, CheB/CheR fusion protein
MSEGTSVEQRERALRMAGEQLHGAVLASIPAHIAVLDADGTIVTTNAAWDRFALQNGSASGLTACGPGRNYLAACRGATGREARQAADVAQGIGDVLAGRRPEFRLEYPTRQTSAGGSC